MSQDRLQAIEERKNRRLNLFIAILLIAILAEAGYILMQSSFFDVRTIEVTGNSRVPRARIIKMSGINRKTGFFRLSEASVEKSIAQEPWIDKVDVDKTRFFNIRITVRERKPVAVLFTGSVYHLLDGNPVVIDVAKQNAFGPIPLIVDSPVKSSPKRGSRIKDKSVRNALDCLKGLDKRIIDEAGTLSAPSIDGLTINLKSGLVIMYGKAELTEQKNYAIDVILEEARKEGKEWKYIDVRVPSNPAAMPVA